MPALRNSRTAPESASPLGSRSSLPRSSSPRSGSPRSGSPLKLTRSSSPRPMSSLSQETRPNQWSLIQGDPLHQQDSSSRRKHPSASAKIGAKIGAKMAAFQVSGTARSPKAASPKATSPKTTSPKATSPPEGEAPVLRPVRGAKIDAKLAALTMLEKAATDAPQLNVKQQVCWKPRNDIFGSYARKLKLDKNATGLPPLRSITDLP